MRDKKMNFEKTLELEPLALRKRQITRGLPLAAVGAVVYAALRITGHRPKNYRGICEYFEIGENWGGFECGLFFVCGKNASDALKAHEIGHAVQNAARGGFWMLAHSAASAVRYWWRRIFGAKTPYDSWKFEGQATDLGAEYVKRWSFTENG